MSEQQLICKFNHGARFWKPTKGKLQLPEEVPFLNLPLDVSVHAAQVW